MNSRTEAHKMFAALYRKQRNADHQKMVDEVITRSNDVFIRIDLIKKIDEEYEKQQRGIIEQAENKASQTVARQTAYQIPAVQQTQKNVTPVNSPQQTQVKQQAVKPQDNQAGLMDRLFGGANPISKFSKETGALDLGLFGRKPTISKNVEKVFRSLKEDEIISAIQALKYSEQVGWRIWKPVEYNIIVNFARFFNAFISLDSLFIDNISPEVFLGRSTKMQMYYARLLSRQDSKDIIMEKVIGLIKNESKLSSKLPAIVSAFTYCLTLESRKPTLIDSIISFHIVNSKKMVSWGEILSSLNIAPIDERKFNATPEISKQIELATTKLTNDIKAKENVIEELEFLKKNFFKFDATGKISFDFLNTVIEDHIIHYYSDTPPTQVEIVKSNFKSNPHKLLQLACKDLLSIYIPIVENYVKAEKNTPIDVLVVQVGLFGLEIEKINNVLRSLDAFNRKFPSFQYTFQSYTQNRLSGTSDQIEAQLIKVLTDASDVFYKFASRLSVLIEGHLAAIETEKSGNASDKLIASKEKVIEEVKYMQRFIPYGDFRLVTLNRINGKYIFESIFEMTRHLYNYAVIFKDANIVAKLNQVAKLEMELNKLYSDYERLTAKPYKSLPVEEEQKT